jgi:DNA end-binding protein Ku
MESCETGGGSTPSGLALRRRMLPLAEHILDSEKADFDASKFHDRYEQTIIEMINVKKADMPVAKQRLLPKIVAGTDLMATLRQSIADTEREDRGAA